MPTSGFVSFILNTETCAYNTLNGVNEEPGGLGFSAIQLEQLKISFDQVIEILAKHDSSFIPNGNFQIFKPLNPGIENPFYMVMTNDHQSYLVDAVTGQVSKD